MVRDGKRQNVDWQSIRRRFRRISCGASICKEKLFDFNSARPSEKNKRNEIIRKLFGLAIHFRYNPRLDVTMESAFPITIGDNVWIGGW